MKKYILAMSFFCLLSKIIVSKEQSFDRYQSALSTRYASEEMSTVFSPQTKFSTWRLVWTSLAEAEKEVGLKINQEQIDEMRRNINSINFEKADEYERKFKHDVMAHVHAFGDQCPKARPIIHLGATSCVITDNADVLIIRKALDVIETKLIAVIKGLANQAEKYKDIACLSFTHFQPAQPTTVGKRITLWLQDFMIDLQDLCDQKDHIPLLGLKGATGTQASFLKLLDGDFEKVRQLETEFCNRLSGGDVLQISGQTYTRKLDIRILQILMGIAVSAQKMATDLRLLANMKEIEEPFGASQIGSSAMPYKRNPMKNERICALARYIISAFQNPIQTASNQWLERTLDDSANRRLVIPDMFMATDALLNLCTNIVNGFVVYPEIIKKNLMRELPFMVTENILMECVHRGNDRQKIHESIRKHAQEAAHKIKMEGGSNNLLDRIANDPEIPVTKKDIYNLLITGNFTGCAAQQVTNFLHLYVYPTIKKYSDRTAFNPEIAY